MERINPKQEKDIPSMYTNLFEGNSHAYLYRIRRVFNLNPFSLYELKREYFRYISYFLSPSCQCQIFRVIFI